MGRHLSTIGFVFESAAEKSEMLSRLATDSRLRLAVEPGDYAVWRSRSGAELWFHVVGSRNEDGTLADDGIVGLTSFFDGASSVGVRIERQVNRDGDSPFVGAWAGWIDPEHKCEVSAYPVVFDAVDFAAHASRPLPMCCTVRLVGFARLLTVYPDEAAFFAAGSETAGLEPFSFVPVGLAAVAANGSLETASAPSSHGLINGRLVEHELLRNEATGFDICRMLIASDATVYEVVADPELVTCAMEPGAIVSAMCWMVGRITDDN